MSLTIIKAGILDTIQDTGRYGFQNAGINPNGAMDQFSARLSNCLVGKKMNAAVIEMHFPAPAIQFNQSTIICITGADFEPVIATKKVALQQPVFVKKQAILEFKKVKSGARCYLSVLHHLQISKWLGSFSTNLKAQAGGFEGRALQAGDTIAFEPHEEFDRFLGSADTGVLPWKPVPFKQQSAQTIECIQGPEWHWLTEAGQAAFTKNTFTISTVADRMGYRLKGTALQVKEQKQLVSSGVGFGTIQLLPNGQLIVLMADHQTTGGYPRIANIISTHLPALAQMNPNSQLRFALTTIDISQQKLLKEHQYLQSVQDACKFKINNILQ
ncbi:MAG: biotin-dependent carboxyltransferase family protein [Bacteroidota bacterium]|nr:biotin-dependent carboxyltransferase family protein [Bacteroidota bacterium]